VTRGYVGVEAQGINEATAKALHLGDDSGALLAGVQPNGPAAKAGLKPGDVIQSVNGQKIANPRDLALRVAELKPGDNATVHVLRGGEGRDVSLKVSQMPNDRMAANEEAAPAGRPQVGLALAPLSPELRGQLDLPEGTQGAVVRQVRPDSPAEQAGLQPGDVIVGVGTQEVASPADAVQAMRKALEGKNHSMALRILRNGEPAFVGVTVGQDAG
jgi:serine protease Do